MAMSSAVQEHKEGRTFRGKLLTAGILLAIFVIAMVIRCAWYYGPAVAPAATYGQFHYVLSGNDPDYHKRAIDYAVETGHALAWDPLMNYPVGGPNPNPPAFAWSSMFMGIAISPFFNFDVNEAVWMFFQAVPAFWAAMTIFPIYFFTRDMFGRKPAYIASFIIAIMAGNVERTPLGFSDHDSFVVFFVVTGFFFLMRALKNLDEKTWVRKWGSAKDISTGMLAFLQGNRISIIYSLMAGLSIAAVMLAWKGVAYIFAILTMYLIVHVLIKRFRKEDPLGISMCVLLAGGVGLLVSFPYYYSMSFINWYETPFFVFVAMGLFATIMVPTRNQPYFIILIALAAIVSAGFAVVYFYFPALYNILLGFQGYFIHDKLYQTIAEAQPPDFSRMVYSYGEYIFYFGLIAIIYQAYRLPKEHFRNDFIFGIAWFAMAIYMAMSAVRFMYNATPVFAILGGWVTWVIIKLLDFKKVVKTYRGLSGGGRWHAVKSSVKLRHVAGAFFLSYMVMASATFYGLDAGIPYETKKQFDKDIYYFLPSQMRPAGYDVQGSGLWWFGSFGTAFPSDYWTDAMFWLQTQDSNFTDEDRPAFVAWWDYGHWCMHMGHHPSIADNFQQGVQISGNIITAQNETSTIAFFIARTVEGNQTAPQVVPILESYLGKEATKDFQDIEGMVDIPHWRAEVLAHPAVYGNRTSDINDLNVKWTALAGLLTSRLSEEQMVEMYNEITKATDREIRYFAADSRMFPFAARNTGIYYAPVKLSDQDIEQFLKVMAVGSDGQEYDPANIPQSVLQDKTFRIVDYKLYYLEPFYNSLFYKAYVGYSPVDAGMSITDGIPSMIGNMRTGQYPPMQGWNLSNFRLEYRTAFWSPYNESTGLANHTDSWAVVPPWTAQKYDAEKEGTVDTFYRNLYQGVFMLKYYHGAIVSGTVTTDKGVPVPNARVTVYDDLPVAISYYPGVPHGCTFTDALGKYTILAPYGNVTVKVTNGGQEGTDDLLLAKESRELATARFWVSDDQAMRHRIDLNSDGIMDFNIHKDFTVSVGNLTGRAYYDEDNSGAYEAGVDRPLSGKMLADNASVGAHYEATIDAAGNYSLSNMTPADYALKMDFEGIDVDGGLAGVDAGAAAVQDVRLYNINVSGNVSFENGAPAGGVSVGVVSGSGEVLWSNTSLENGTFLVERLLPGSYNVSVVGDGFLLERTAIEVNQSANQTLNVTAIPLVNLSGIARLSPGAGPAPGAFISFQNLDNSSRSASVTAGPDGSFRAKLVSGNYTVYAIRPVSGSEVHVGLVDLHVGSRADQLVLSMVRGVKLNGTVFRDMNQNGTYDPGTPGLPDQSGGAVTSPEYQPGATVEVDGPDGLVILPCNILGQYEAYLPSGIYVVRAERSASDIESYVNVTLVNLTATLQLNLSLSKGVRLSGTVYWDRNGNDLIEDGEQVAGARLQFYEKKRPDHQIEVMTGENGTYVQNISQITEYGVNLYAKGFNGTTESLVTGIDPQQRDFKMVAVPALVNMTLTAGGAPAPSGLNMYITTSSEGSKGAELTTDAHGRVSSYFMPGTYTVSVGQNASTAAGTVNLSMVQPFNVSVGQAAIELGFSLDQKVYIAGVVFYDENGDGIPQRAEYRNALVKFIPESAIGDVAASAPGIPSLPTVISQNTFEGRYETALPPGNYTAWSLVELPTPEGPPQVFIRFIQADRSATLNISLEPGCKVRGLVFTDLNGNSKYDEGEQRSGVPVAFTENGNTFMTVGSDPGGFYELTLPQGGEYSLAVRNTTQETLTEATFVPIRYIASANLTVPPRNSLDQNISVLRQVSVVGRVSYDRNGDGGPGADEGVSQIRVVFTAPDKTVNVSATNSTGDFEIYLEQVNYDLSVDAPGYNSSVAALKSADVSLEKRVFNFSLEAVNATVSFSVRLDGQPARLPGGAAVSLQALDGMGQNASGRTDAGGLLMLSLRPGIYSLYVTGVHDGARLAHLGPLDIEPSGTPVAAPVDLALATRMWGVATIPGGPDGRAAPDHVDFVFNTTMNVSGRNFTASINFSGQSPVFELFVPASNFSISASYSTVENAQNITYNITVEANITAGQGSYHRDLTLRKVMDRTIGLGWAATQKVTVPANSSANYTMQLANMGNNRTTVNLEISKPSGWGIDLSIKKVTLEIGENLTVFVNITVPPSASAGENTITINASASEQPYQFYNSTPLSVDVIQHYGLSLENLEGPGSTTTGGVTYSFKVTNTGNGQDTINLSATGPHGWTLTLSDFNPLLSGGESRNIQITATPFTGARIENGLTTRIKAISKNELVPPQEISVNMTFPKLSAGDLKATGKGVSIPSSNIPGFTSAAALSVVALAAVAMAVRRRRSR
jgi:dolichyl-diphosphooligosaccharide--protein glycosyltransferase